MQIIQLATKYHLAKAFSVRLWCVSFFLLVLPPLLSGHYLGTAFEGVYAKVIMTICLNACGNLKRGPTQNHGSSKGVITPAFGYAGPGVDRMLSPFS
jgi:hypothetical protein